MFEFFRDAIDEMKGVDMVSAHQQRKENLKNVRNSYYIFSQKARVLIYVLAALYIAVAVYTVYRIVSYTGEIEALSLARYIVQSLIALAVCACLGVSKHMMGDIVVGRKRDIPKAIKKLEIIAGGGILLFMATLLASVSFVFAG